MLEYRALQVKSLLQPGREVMPMAAFTLTTLGEGEGLGVS
jgi:hypothetical protein